MLQTHTTPEPDIFAFMNGSHRHLERAGAQLLESVRVDDRVEIVARWRGLEGQLLAHLEAEERHILPAFARADRDEALAIVRQHGQIRERLLELGVAVELHQLRLHVLEDFIATLHAHADREENLMYKWAAALLDDRISGPARRHIEKVTR